MNFEEFGSESKSFPAHSVDSTQLGTNASSSSKLRGIWAPCLTPIKDNYTIDQLRLQDHIDWLVSNGCSGVVLFGTTGEAASFSATERMTALEKAHRFWRFSPKFDNWQRVFSNYRHSCCD